MPEIEREERKHPSTGSKTDEVAQRVSLDSVQMSGCAPLTEIVFIGFGIQDCFAAIDTRLRLCLLSDEEVLNSSKTASANPIKLLPPSWTELGIAQGRAQRTWSWVVLALAMFTVGWNAVEGVVSIRFGIEDESWALVGFGLDSFVEVFSALLVVFRVSKEIAPEKQKAGHKEKQLQIERLTARGAGGLLFMLGVLAVIGGAMRLADGGHPDSSVPSIVIASISLSFMFVLWFEKMRAARALSSATLSSDAACLFDCIKLSFVLLIGGLLFAIDDMLWWVDAVVTIILGAFILKEGLGIVKNSFSASFDGSAHCCNNHGWADNLFEGLERCLGFKAVTVAGISSEAEVGIVEGEWTWNGNLTAASDTVLFEDVPLDGSGKPIKLQTQEVSSDSCPKKEKKS